MAYLALPPPRALKAATRSPVLMVPASLASSPSAQTMPTISLPGTYGSGSCSRHAPRRSMQSRSEMEEHLTMMTMSSGLTQRGMVDNLCFRERQNGK